MNTIIELTTNIFDNDHMDGNHMMGWFGFSSLWFVMILIWLILIVIAFYIYTDAEKRGMNGLLWFVLVILPWIGVFFLILYLIIRDDKTDEKITTKSANLILDERYARGEINRNEYLQMKKDITNIKKTIN
jgi:putative membrane protein